MKVFKAFFASLIFALIFAPAAIAQGAPSQIERANVGAVLQAAGGEVKSVAMTRSCLMGVYGKNGWCQSTRIPQSLYDKLKDAQNRGITVYDVHIAENGEWAILGDSIALSNGCPRVVEDCVTKLFNANDSVICVSFNEYGDYAVIGEKSYYASANVKSSIEAAKGQYGRVLYANITNFTYLITCENGCWSSAVWENPVMQHLERELANAPFRPKIVKIFYDGSYFIGNQQTGQWTADF